MGLLERALQYKQKINDSGKSTLIDKIKGPAESGTYSAINIKNTEIDENLELENTPGTNIHRDIIETDNFNVNNAENKETEEEIVFFNDDLNKIDNLYDNKILPDNIKTPETIDIIQDKINNLNDSSDNNYEKSEDTSKITENQKSIENFDFEMPEFNDYGVLYEIQKEFFKAETIEEVYSTILFSVMGQLGVSSVSIIASSEDNNKKWIITDSHGIKISSNDIFWDIDTGILKLLNTYKGVLDIEDIKNDLNLRDDYYKFTGVDARIITPLLKDGILAGAILVGEKINSEEFNPIEIDFLRALSEIGSSTIESLAKYEKINTEFLGLRIEKEILSDVELFQDSLLTVSSIDELAEVIKKNFYSLGLECYSLFIKDQIDGDYFPAYYDPGDLLGFSNSGFKIKRDNRLIAFLLNKKSSIILESFNESSVIIDTFGRSRITKMEIFITYPFIISGKLSGFITIFKINPAIDIMDVDIRIQKINRFLLPYIHRVYELDPNINRYSDLTERFYNRVENELLHAKELSIPLSLLSINIKNYKRFYERFGKTEFDRLATITSEIIKVKLNAGDFFARVDRNRFLIVLPGKEKRYSIMLANSMKNEIIEKYNMSDFKLLVSTMNSVFPEDGSDLFSLLEVVD